MYLNGNSVYYIKEYLNKKNIFATKIGAKKHTRLLSCYVKAREAAKLLIIGKDSERKEKKKQIYSFFHSRPSYPPQR